MAPLSKWTQVDSGLSGSRSKVLSLTVCTSNIKSSESALREAFLAYYLQADDPCRKRIDLAIEHCNTLRIVSLFEGVLFKGHRICYQAIVDRSEIEEQRSRHQASFKRAVWPWCAKLEGHHCYKIQISEEELGSL